MFKQIDDYKLQVKLFCEHLEQDFLAGFIIGPKKLGRNRSIHLDENGNNLTCIQIIQANENLYFVPQVCEEYGTDKCVRAVKTLFVDLDETNKEMTFDEFIKPNLVIRRTDGRAYQAFYFLEESISAREFKKYQEILATYYNSDPSLINVNRLGRIAGVTRGFKTKDKTNNIASGLYYEVVSHQNQKLTKEDLKLLTKMDFENKTADIPLTSESSSKEKHKQSANTIEEFFEDAEEATRSFHTEEVAFYDFFRNKNKGTGTSNALYRFAGYLLDRGVSLSQFKQYCDDNGIPANDISNCDDEEFELIGKNVKKYAKNKKKVEQAKEEKQIKNSEKMDFDKLFQDYPYLPEVFDELKKYYFVENEDTFYREDFEVKLTKISKTTFNTTFQKYTRLRTPKGKFVKSMPVDLFLSYGMRHFFNVTSSTTYAPHESRVIKEKNSKLLNTWLRPLQKVEHKGDLTIFLKHVDWLFKDQKTVDGKDLGEFFLDYLAYVYCNPKPANFAWLMYSRKMGAGRSFFRKIMIELLGRDNVSTPTPKIASDQYTTWYTTKQFAIVEELQEDDGIYQQLLPVLGNEDVSHREMHKNSTMVVNYCNMIFLTNKINCLKIAQEDRRFLVVHMHQEVQPKEYYDELYEWKKNEDNIAALAEFLIKRNKIVDEKIMLGNAPITDAKLLMQRINKNSTIQDLEQNIENHSFGVHKQFIDQKTIIESLYPNIQDAAVKYRNIIATNMEKLGYIPLFSGKKIRIGDRTENLTIFIASQYAEKYIRDVDFKSVINEYKEYKKIPIEKKETISESDPVLVSVSKPSQSNETIVVTEEKQVIENIQTQKEPAKTRKPRIIKKKEPMEPKIRRPKEEKVHPLVAEARRRAANPNEVRVVPTIQDLIDIRTKRMSQILDVSILYH